MEKQSFDNGRFICIYGPTGVGKTTTLLQTCSNPIYYIQTEPRSLKPSIDAAARVDLDMDVAVYEGWNHLMESVLNPSNLVRYNTIILDSLSFIMNVELPVEIADQAFDARTEAEKQVKPLAGQTKLSQEGYGVLSALIFRLTAALGKLSRAGKVVVVTALLQETPKWNRALAAAPSLKGKEFPVNAPSFFDLIGLVETRTDTDGHIIYPPYVRFQSPDDSFLAKWTGVGTKTEGPLNITKILKL